MADDTMILDEDDSMPPSHRESNINNLNGNNNNNAQANNQVKFVGLEHAREIIQNDEYTWEERQVYLRGIERALGAYNSQAKAFIDVSDVEQYSDTPENAMKWISNMSAQMNTRLGKKQISNTNLQKLSNSLHNHGMELMERERLVAQADNLEKAFGRDTQYQELEDIYGYIARGKKELDGETAIIASEQFKDRKAKIEANALKLLGRLEDKYPNHDWDSKTAKKVGAAIDVLKTVNPEKGKKFMAYMDVKKTERGYEAIGPEGMFSRIDVFAENLLKAVRDADPMLMRSSNQYKDLKSSVENLLSFEKDAHKRVKNGEAVVDEFIGRLTAMLNHMDNMALQYTNYKRAALGGRNPNSIETKRLNVANQTRESASAMAEAIRIYHLEVTRYQEPETMIKAVELEVHASNPAYREKQLGEMLYLQLVKKSLKENPDLDVQGALEYKHMNREVDKLMAEPAFTKVVNGVPENLEGENAQKLIYASFINEKNKEYGMEDAANQIKQENPQKQKNGPEVNQQVPQSKPAAPQL